MSQQREPAGANWEPTGSYLGTNWEPAVSQQREPAAGAIPEVGGSQHREPSQRWEGDSTGKGEPAGAIGEPAGAGWEPAGATRSQREPPGATRSQREPAGSQREPAGASGSQLGA